MKKLKVHLTPKNVSFLNKSSFNPKYIFENNFNLVKFSIFCDFLNCGKSRLKRRHFGSSPSEATIGESGTSDVNTRTYFPRYQWNQHNFTYLSIVCERNAYDLCCCWLQQPKRWRSRYIAARDSIFQGRSSGGKEAKEEKGRFCQTEESKVAVIEALGDMLRALQTWGFWTDICPRRARREINATLAS